VLPPQAVFSTHDWTDLVLGGGGIPPLTPGVNDFREVWADTKSPGDGSVYNVGTIEVRFTASAYFSATSGAPNVEPALSLPPFFVGALPAPARQVVILQQADVAGPGLGFQRFYHGTNTGGVFRATNARAVSVWPAINSEDTRIAICGETEDELLPLGNAPQGWPGAGGTGTSGFIAMFNGAGDLLWSHHFFGNAANEHCAITDVSVRVEYVAGVPTTDYVTFCGISSYGNPAANLTLSAVQPFAAVVAICPNGTGGATDSGPGQWDGIVGRLSHSHGGAGATTTQYLSSVGGIQQDGLFGIAEINEDRFAVVGSTGMSGVVGTGTAEFPATWPFCPSAAPGYSAGVVAVFRFGTLLILDSSQIIGEQLTGTNTIVRDVLVQRDWSAAGDPGLIVVGSTDDPNLLLPKSLIFTINAQPQAVIGGGADGFVLTGTVTTTPSPAVEWDHGTFRGGVGQEGLVGVQGWSEFYDHFAVTGLVDSGATDIDVATYYRTPVAAGSNLVLLAGGLPAVGLGGAQIGGSFFDRPTAMGIVNATSLGAFVEFGLGNPAGGGVTVDQTGRVNVVGTTLSADYPPTAAPLGRPKVGMTFDAVRVAMDMLPPGVGRTDGTGSPVPIGGPVGGYPLPGFFGGTTPECALTPFGHQIGLTDPQVAPALPRMLIDYEGPAPASGVSGVAIVVSRPPLGSALLAAALQFSFPGAIGGGFTPIVLLPDGVLFWTSNTSGVFVVSPSGMEPLRFPLGPLPVGSFTITAQLISLLGVPVAGGSQGPICPGGGQAFLAASPALWLDY